MVVVEIVDTIRASLRREEVGVGSPSAAILPYVQLSGCPLSPRVHPHCSPFRLLSLSLSPSRSFSPLTSKTSPRLGSIDARQYCCSRDHIPPNAHPQGLRASVISAPPLSLLSVTMFFEYFFGFREKIYGNILAAIYYLLLIRIAFYRLMSHILIQQNSEVLFSFLLRTCVIHNKLSGHTSGASDSFAESIDSELRRMIHF